MCPAPIPHGVGTTDFDTVSYTVPHMIDTHTNFDYPRAIGY